MKPKVWLRSAVALLGRQVVDAFAVEVNGALVGLVEGAEQVQQRALARAGGADDAEKLAGSDLAGRSRAGPAPCPHPCGRSCAGWWRSASACSLRDSSLVGDGKLIAPRPFGERVGVRGEAPETYPHPRPLSPEGRGRNSCSTHTAAPAPGAAARPAAPAGR